MLNAKVALDVVTPLRLVKDFPRDQAALDAVAEDLIDLTLDCDENEAKQRAQWVVTEIRRHWDEWSGSKDLILLYRSRWPEQREVKSEDNEAKQYGQKPGVDCLRCGDNGVIRPTEKEPWRWCECQAGVRLHFELPDWLELLNREVPPPPPAVPELTHPAAARPVHTDIENGIVEEPDCPACQEGRWHTHQEFWRHHTTEEKTA